MVEKYVHNYLHKIFTFSFSWFVFDLLIFVPYTDSSEVVQTLCVFV